MRRKLAGEHSLDLVSNYMSSATFEKIGILANGAKYDVSCSSSGGEDNSKSGQLGCNAPSGICHSFTEDGRCVSLLKVLFTNVCIYDCSYCFNRASHDIPRASFTPRELAELTVHFYKRNYIEGLFLSSGVVGSEDNTMRLLNKTLRILRFEYKFGGYIHLKLIPGASEDLIEEGCRLATRVSSNLELSNEHSLKLLAPQKSKEKIFHPLKLARDLSLQKNSKPIPMSTQLIVGATGDSDFEILRLSSYLYNKALLKRVYYSAYIDIQNRNLPLPHNYTPPLQREHRLYQADWLLRFYGFSYDELLCEDNPFLDMRLDPKSQWALNNLHLFPLDINKCDKEMLLRIPGIGMRGVYKILKARKYKALSFEDLQNMKISLKRAQYFIYAKGLYHKRELDSRAIRVALIEPKKVAMPTLFDFSSISGEL